MRRRRSTRSYRSMSDINIANLVDVVLVLLIIFMISAPLLQSGIEVDLPRTRTAAIEQETEGVVVTVDSKGGIYINDVWTKLDSFAETLKAEIRRKGTSSVYLRVDSTVMYGRAVAVIAEIKQAGVQDIGLVTTPQEESR